MEATRYPWAQAVRKLHRVQSPQLRDSVEETLWASGDPHKCSEPCVAHCLVGLWRQHMNVRPEWPRVTRQQFDLFSPAYAIFAVWSISGMIEEPAGQLRSPSPPVEVQAVEERLLALRPSRALIVKERCQTQSCWYNLSRMKCDRIGGPYTVLQVPRDYLMCDVQVDRLRQCMALVREYEKDHGMKFDWITRDRVDYKFSPVVPVTTLARNTTYMTPWCEWGENYRSCFGGMDWWYAMPRAHADVVAGFRDGIDCSYLDREEIRYHDPVLNTPTNCVSNLGCEGWLASWLFGQGVPFVGLGCTRHTGTTSTTPAPSTTSTTPAPSTTSTPPQPKTLPAPGAEDPVAAAPAAAAASPPAPGTGGGGGGAVARYPWERAVRRFVKIPEPAMRDSLQETIWASGAPHACSEPCVAHCLVGQWRNEMNTRPEWPEVTREQFATFSPASVVFAVWSVSGVTEWGGWTKNIAPKVQLEDLVRPLTQLRPNRALIVSERCTDSRCYYDTTRMKCHENWTEAGRFWQSMTYYDLYGQCDIQVDRVRQCMELVRQYEQDHGMKFDWVTRDRVDYKWHPPVPATSLNRSLTYMSPWCEAGGARACFGGFDWWYAMPRAHADVIAGFRDGIDCSYVDRKEIREHDPVMNTPTNCFRSLGCEGWLAAWMFGQKIPFTGLGCQRVP